MLNGFHFAQKIFWASFIIGIIRDSVAGVFYNMQTRRGSISQGKCGVGKLRVFEWILGDKGFKDEYLRVELLGQKPTLPDQRSKGEGKI